jgi:putative DNA primase/helicase
MPDDRKIGNQSDDLDALNRAIDAATPVDGGGAGGDDGGGIRPPPGSEGDDELNRALCQVVQSDTGNAYRLRRRFGTDLLHVDQMGWAAWDGRRYTLVLGESGAVRRAQWTAALMLSHELKALRDIGPPLPGDLEKNETDPGHKKRYERDRVEGWEKELGAFRRKAIDAGNAGKVGGMLAMAQGDLAVTADDIDRPAYLVNLGNGVLSLDRRDEVAAWKAAQKQRAAGYDGCSDDDPLAPPPPWTLHPHRREDRLTRLAGADFRPDTDCPHFAKFIAEILPDDDVRAFIQRLFGYCLLGMIDEQVFVVFWGSGKNGKSRLVDIMRHVFGDYSATVPAGLFLDKRNDDPDKPRPSLAKLMAKRIAFMSEPKRGGKLDEGLVKEVTGGEPIQSRKLHQDEFEYTPVFTPIMSTNIKPDIRGLDNGIWRRIMLVPFTVTIPPERRDRNLLEKLRPEADGVLNWCLSGLWDYYIRGLDPPAAVVEAIEEYKADSDPLARFLDARTMVCEGWRVGASDLYADYEEWCGVNAEEPLGKKSFALSLKERGIRSIKSGNNYWVGLKRLD